MTAEHCLPDGLLRLPNTRAALAYAERLHAGQRRGVDGAPFIVHPFEVACLLFGGGARDRVIAAGALHDTIEKTDADAADLRTRFGVAVKTLVLAVSEDKRISSYVKRKAALREQVAQAGHEAMMVFAADKISKVRELSLENAGTRQRPTRVPISPDRRLAHYRNCLRLLEELLTDSPLVKQLRTELEAITTPRAKPGLRAHRRASETGFPALAVTQGRQRGR